MYNLHIIKNNDWRDQNGGITRKDWEYIQSIFTDLIKEDEHTLVYESSVSKEKNKFFFYDDGEITIGNCDDESLQRAVEIAKTLNANAQGDDGEFY